MKFRFGVVSAFSLILASISLPNAARADGANPLLPDWITSEQYERHFKNEMMDRNSDRDFVYFDSVKIKGIHRGASDLLSSASTAGVIRHYTVELITERHGRRMDLQCTLSSDISNQSLLTKNCKRWDVEARAWVRDPHLDISSVIDNSDLPSVFAEESSGSSSAHGD